VGLSLWLFRNLAAPAKARTTRNAVGPEIRQALCAAVKPLL